MQSITLRNFRCFGDEPQTAFLAPLTLLVGENSSGKTSLMAMVRAMWDIAYDERAPDFKEEPYDLGSFDEIAHRSRVRGQNASEFEATVELTPPKRARNGTRLQFSRLAVEFAEKWSAPVPVRRRAEVSTNPSADGEPDFWIEHRTPDDETESLDVGTPDGAWRCVTGVPRQHAAPSASQDPLVPLESLSMRLRFGLREGRPSRWDIQPLGNSPELTEDIVVGLERAVRLRRRVGGTAYGADQQRPFASAPVRSQPRRTYDPVRITADSFGDAIPTYLGQMERRTPEAWQALKAQLEEFGRSAEMFDELKIRRHGKQESDPFQLQVRRSASRTAEPFRNLIDVGYGVSQVLPVITELLRPGGPQTALLQQPEVHLHPVAQASLGTLLCRLTGADAGRQESRSSSRRTVTSSSIVSVWPCEMRAAASRQRTSRLSSSSAAVSMCGCIRSPSIVWAMSKARPRAIDSSFSMNSSAPSAAEGCAG